MVKRNDEEEENGDKDKPSILDRVGAAAEAAGERVRRSTEVMTGADIRQVRGVHGGSHHGGHWRTPGSG